MALDITPATWLGTGYSFASHVAGFEGSAGANPVLAGLTDAEGNASTGDIRKVFFELSEAAYQAWRTQSTASNLPTKMTLNRSSIENPDGTLTRTYSFQFIVTTGTIDVASE